jgi:two-component system chemotaxis response regulator CheY
MTLRVLIADDHPGFRHFAAVLLSDCGFEVIGQVGTGAEAVHGAITSCPDVVLLDVMLPDIDGFEAAHQLAAAVPPPRVVLISSRQRSDYGHRVDTSEASGFISKDELTGERLKEILADS